ncbi:methionyl-tRNA formyltransferase [Desulfobotulus alkaliphilus]|uniref:Methionyl-tRNA formyltransferase n=1 Tax=Desulfobotulus alkaliphilus TaxID=622671 RepID=A0A562RSA3_9BACT|nr:methionyl-tRNA formyltransferase [Desulfobotulus alkaliphilus]TWI71206.1 methionyl-tRNA formyltransferase [Desulfobotulus alkaliphilus]
MIPLNLVFMGTPEFALPPLQALAGAGHRILAAYTQPDKPKGRGKKIQPPPVKEAALSLGIPVFQPSSMKDEKIYHELSALSPDVFVVVAYGHILPARLLEIPRLGAVNIHASLLPRYRGAAPIQWAVTSGESRTGVTTMRMDAGMDTGDILLQRSLPIGPQDTSADIHDKLSILGAELILETLEGLAEGSIQPLPQNAGEATYAPLLKKSHGRINWDLPAPAIDAHVRGMNPWPGAFTRLGETDYKIFKVQPLAMEHQSLPGTVLPSPPGSLIIAAAKDAVVISELQGPSGKRMGIADFLRGKPLNAGMLFS